MRICILLRSIPPYSADGIARNRWAYAKLLQQKGWEVHVICDGVTGTEDYKDKIFIHEVSSKDAIKSYSHLFSMLTEKNNIFNLCYSYAVYKRVEQLNKIHRIDIVDNSLWEYEGLFVKLKLPFLKMVTRIDTTSKLIAEINSGSTSKNSITQQNEIELYLLYNSDFLVFNSWSILKETQRLYEISFENKMYAVINHSIKLKQSPAHNPVQKELFHVLIPGRLEKRKGTLLLIKEVLPVILEKETDFVFHFAGNDNSDWDGFKEEYGCSYTDFIKQTFYRHINKKIFLHGFVTDEKLNELYEQADCVLAPSLYESFGLVYLEAVNHNKPLVAIDRGAVAELFEKDKEVLLTSINHPKEIIDSLKKLKNQPELSKKLTENARKKLETFYAEDMMADRFVEFIEHGLTNEDEGIVYQVMNSLIKGDGVSSIVLDYDKMFKSDGQPTQIIGNFASESLSHLSKQIHEIQFTSADTIIYHYCGHCEWAEYINSIEGPKKILFFHNITTPHFFKEGSTEYISVVNGFRQAPLLTNFDYYVALSDYSYRILEQLIPRKLNGLTIPNLVDKSIIEAKPYNNVLVKQLKSAHAFHIIFVGRVVPHKKQIDILRLLKYFKNTYNDNFHASIIGGGMESYITEINQFIKKNDLVKNVTVTGKISDADLYAYYRSAHVFISMSEHEGFGIPLAEAMVFQVPVMAYGITAIPETVGDNGCVFYEKDYASIAATLFKLQKNEAFRNEVVVRQHNQLTKYSKSNIDKVVKKMFEETTLLQKERINELANASKLSIEEFVNFKDSRLTRKGIWHIADNRTLISYGNDTFSILELTAAFSEIDIFIINHPSSGKVSLYLNDEEIIATDLYAPVWSVKKYTISANKKGSLLNTIRVYPRGEKCQASNGKEVIVYGFRLKKYTLSIKKSILENVNAVYSPDQLLQSSSVENTTAV
jgi:L-malate glycosyltransferase